MWSCIHCGQVIFTEAQVIEKRRLWDLGEYTSEVFLIRDAYDWSALRRYDASLHHGWYCCRFILMRMTVDKFGTGDKLIVYADSVRHVDSTPALKKHPAIRLGTDDFDAVVAATPGLAVVKLGAIWCPPCRMMDAAIAKLPRRDGVTFFEVDIDEQPALAERFATTSIPHTRVYRDGQLVGEVTGGLDSRGIARLCDAALNSRS